MSGNKGIVRLTNEIISQVNDGTLAVIAEGKIHEVLNSHDVKNAIERELEGPIKEKVAVIIQSEDMQKKIHAETLKRVSTLLGPVITNILGKVVDAMNRKQ